MIGLCIAIAIVGAAGRYLQGNGHKGIGRGIMGGAMAVAAVMGLGLDYWEITAWAAVVASANLWAGYTRWDDVPYSVVRYGLPGAIAVMPYAMMTGNASVMLYAIPCALVAVTQFYLGQHKPQWLIDLVGNRDVATIPAGALVTGGMAALHWVSA